MEIEFFRLRVSKFGVTYTLFFWNRNFPIFVCGNILVEVRAYWFLSLLRVIQLVIIVS